MQIVNFLFRMGHHDNGVTPGYSPSNGCEETPYYLYNGNNTVFYYLNEVIFETFIFMYRCHYNSLAQGQTLFLKTLLLNIPLKSEGVNVLYRHIGVDLKPRRQGLFTGFPLVNTNLPYFVRKNQCRSVENQAPLAFLVL